MSLDVLLGLQWGDEGKGKIVDVLTASYDIIARFQGGPNAGHTLVFNNKKFILHTIPSGVFHDNALNIIGNGVVLDPLVFLKEIESIGSEVPSLFDKLLISKKVHLILPTHRLLDAAYEKAKGGNKIGSTLKGIGPTYTDKIARIGVRTGDILKSDFLSKYDNLKKQHLHILSSLNFDVNSAFIQDIDFKTYEKKWIEALDILKSFKFIDSEVFINNALQSGKTILAEGAQGSLLDIDFGTYPFVTSSNTTSSGVCSGLGVAPQKIKKVIGVFKAYCTRVGSGPFPTELFDATASHLSTKGAEFGSTTGRPRRCGWLDLPALKYACMINGVTELIMMKADVLSGLKDIKVTTHYRFNNEVIDYVPFDFSDAELKPIYESFEGWHDELSDVSEAHSFPKQLKNYIKFIENYLGIPINIVSLGPDRKQTIYLNN